ncbi:ccr4 associated factor [Basidiobolus ranarum]|uniref:Ccr4 associated factor n=1 Tax=Basidiobolus ranarum TaxID=34480 RepID=A0ABR2WV61_9FUNG
MNISLGKISTPLRALVSTALLKRSNNRTFTTISPLSPTHEKDPLHEGDNFLKVPDRGILQIHGDDTVKFLQGIITNHMPHIATGGDGFFTAFLAPNGRVLYDAFIYPKNQGLNFSSPVFLIECSSASTKDLLKHIKKYILRSRVKIQDVSEEYNVWNLWGPKANFIETGKPVNIPQGSMILKEIGDIRCKDTRYPGLGNRIILPSDKVLSLPADFNELNSREYTIRRILHGVPEGPDFFTNTSLPLESNFDYMNGIDFRKGCYVGQELTIRTYHTGVTRKRILPVQITSDAEVISSTPTQIKVDRSVELDLPPPAQDIIVDGTKNARNNAKFCGGIHNIGLALVRLELLQKPDIKLRTEGSNGNPLNVHPVIPDWWPKN